MQFLKLIRAACMQFYQLALSFQCSRSFNTFHDNDNLRITSQCLLLFSRYVLSEDLNVRFINSKMRLLAISDIYSPS